MFENPRRGRQARNFTTNAPKILGLKSSSEQIFSRKLPLGAPDLKTYPSRTILREVSPVSSLILRAKPWLAKKVLRHENRFVARVRRLWCFGGREATTGNASGASQPRREARLPQNLVESPRLEQTGKDKGLPLFTCHTSIKTVNARTDSPGPGSSNVR